MIFSKTGASLQWRQLGISTALRALLHLCRPELPAQDVAAPHDSLFTKRPCPEATPKHISLHMMLQRDIRELGFVPCLALLYSICMHV